jgi:hypothetical protein
MATRAEKFRALSERANSKKKPKRRPKPTAARAAGARAKARAAMVERHDGTGARVPHNAAPRIEKSGSAYELEATSSRRPSRKSTRKSPGHVKPDTSMRIRATGRSVSPESRSGRRARRPRRRFRVEEE